MCPTPASKNPSKMVALRLFVNLIVNFNMLIVFYFRMCTNRISGIPDRLIENPQISKKQKTTTMSESHENGSLSVLVAFIIVFFI